MPEGRRPPGKPPPGPGAKRPPRRAAAGGGARKPPGTGKAPVRAAGRRDRRGTPAPQPDKPERIAKLLARAGVGSRRDIERMIAEGRVALEGKVLETPATLVAGLEGVTVDGRPVAAAEATRLFLFHKPPGFLTTTRDPGGRPTIFDILPPGLPRLMPVGRLDMNTEGLLLLTNDGGLKRALELPASGVPRQYRVRAQGDVKQEALEKLALGVTIDGVRYGPIDASVERRAAAGAANVWLAMKLAEGKNREVRRVCEALGLRVSRLIRVAYGPFLLGEIPARGLVEAPAGQVADLKRRLGQ